MKKDSDGAKGGKGTGRDQCFILINIKVNIRMGMEQNVLCTS